MSRLTKRALPCHPRLRGRLATGKGRQRVSSSRARGNTLARAPLPQLEDNRLANAEVQRRRLEIESLKWTLARTQPWGIRDKKEDAPQDQTITISWGGDAVAVKSES